MVETLAESGYVCVLAEKLTKDEERELREYLQFIRKLQAKPKERNHD